MLSPGLCEAALHIPGQCVPVARCLGSEGCGSFAYNGIELCSVGFPCVLLWMCVMRRHFVFLGLQCLVRMASLVPKVQDLNL